MSDQYDYDNSAPDENRSGDFAVPNFDPHAFYYFRFARDPSKFMKIFRVNSNTRRFTVSDYIPQQDQEFRFRITQVNLRSDFHISNNTFNANDHLVVFAGTLQLAGSPMSRSNFIFREVRQGIYEFYPAGHTLRLVGLQNGITENNPEVITERLTQPQEIEWVITSKPYASLPSPKPIEEGIYTIHTTRLPSSVIETPLRTQSDSEPFIKHQDGTFTQLWQFVYDRPLNAYQIISYNDECLFAYDSGRPGTPPRQRYRLRFTSRLNQTTASYWYVNPHDGGSFTLVSVKYPEQKFDLTLGITTDFNRIQLYEQNEHEAQNWLLHRVQ